MKVPRAALELLVLMLLAACGEQLPDVADPIFPESFLWGTAIAGFQAEMGCPTLPREQCDDPHSDWYQFTTDPRAIASKAANLSGQDPSRVGPGFWELYEEDFQRAKDELSNNALRMSIEWSRIFPTATDGVEDHEALLAMADTASIAHYHAMFDALRTRGLTPMVTLNHYTLPSWIHDAVGCHLDLKTCSPRGWVDKDRTVREIAKYAAFCAREFGDQIDLWVTLNEPLQNLLFGYLMPGQDRTHPPAVSLRVDEAKIAFAGLVEAHARMYDAIKDHDTVDVDGDGDASFIGVVYPLAPILPKDPDQPLDRKAAENIDYLWNRGFLNAVALGQYDESFDRSTTLRDDLAGRMDFIGLNWYFALRVEGTEESILPDFSPLLTLNPFDFKTVDNPPGALAPRLRMLNEELGFPVIVTENGIPDPDDDGTAPRYLVQNLMEIQQAISDGADVRGYFYWTLMDNYEWNHGMDIRMGLYAVDKDDPQRRRVARQAAGIYGEICRTRTIPDKLIATYGHQPGP